MLTLAGYHVIAAIDGRDALVKALSEPPKLVIIEMHLPIVSGYELSDILRSDRVTRSIPIVAVTDETHPADLERAVRIGVDAILSKPATPGILL